MNIYARIRKIEEPDAFKRFFNTLMGASHPEDFEPTKEWHDFGVDGYLKSEQKIYAVYCPKYPERKDQQQYRDKIASDIDKLNKALKQGKISFPIKAWCFVTPDDLSTEIKNLIKELTEKNDWMWATLTAQNLAPLFMAYEVIHKNFPKITAGLQYDRVASVYVKHINNKGYPNLEIFNNGTESIQDLEVETNSDGTWQNRNGDFLYDFDDPTLGSNHTCFTLKKGERQYINGVPRFGNYIYRISGVGVESGKTFNTEGQIQPIQA